MAFLSADRSFLAECQRESDSSFFFFFARGACFLNAERSFFGEALALFFFARSALLFFGKVDVDQRSTNALCALLDFVSV